MMLVGPSTINIFFIFNVEVTKVLIKIENGEGYLGKSSHPSSVMWLTNMKIWTIQYSTNVGTKM